MWLIGHMVDLPSQHLPTPNGALRIQSIVGSSQHISAGLGSELHTNSTLHNDVELIRIKFSSHEKIISVSGLACGRSHRGLPT